MGCRVLVSCAFVVVIVIRIHDHDVEHMPAWSGWNHVIGFGAAGVRRKHDKKHQNHLALLESLHAMTFGHGLRRRVLFGAFCSCAALHKCFGLKSKLHATQHRKGRRDTKKQHPTTEKQRRNTKNKNTKTSQNMPSVKASTEAGVSWSIFNVLDYTLSSVFLGAFRLAAAPFYGFVRVFRFKLFLLLSTSV